jgi:cytochrome c oxidase subunit 3
MHLHELGAWWGRNPFPNEDGTVATTNFTNFFFTITGFHGLHVTSGVILNIVILANVVKGTYEERGHYEMIEKVGLYWHFVDLVWVFVFTCFYLL